MIKPGERYNALVEYANKMKNDKLDRDTALWSLRRKNFSECSPSLQEEDVRAIFQSVYDTYKGEDVAITPAEAIKILVEAGWTVVNKNERAIELEKSVYYACGNGHSSIEEAIETFLKDWQPEEEKTLEDALAHLKQLIAPNAHVEQAIAIIEKHIGGKDERD
jgi:hypothetical protein